MPVERTAGGTSLIDVFDADEGDPDPGVDDDALIQDAIENIDETRAAGCAFNGHCSSSCVLGSPAPAAPSRGGVGRGRRRSEQSHLSLEFLHLLPELLGIAAIPAG